MSSLPLFFVALVEAVVAAVFFVGLDVGLDVDAPGVPPAIFVDVRVEPVDDADATEFDRDLVDLLGGIFRKGSYTRLFWD